MQRQIYEMLIGGGMLVVAALFLVFAYSREAAKQAGEYELVARFTEVGALVEGDPVRISGIRVGTLVKKEIDPETFDVVLVFTVADNILLPVDSKAHITGESLAGGKYVKLVPGSSETMLAARSEIKDTKDAINVEALVGELIKLAVGSDDE